MSEENTAPDPVVIEPTLAAPTQEGTVPSKPEVLPPPRKMPPEIKRLRDSHGKHYVLVNGTLRSITPDERMSKKERLRRRKANKKE